MIQALQNALADFPAARYSRKVRVLFASGDLIGVLVEASWFRSQRRGKKVGVLFSSINRYLTFKSEKAHSGGQPFRLCRTGWLIFRPRATAERSRTLNPKP